MLHRLEKKLATLEAWQIAAIAVAVFVLGVSAFVFGLAPLVTTLLLPISYHLAGAAGLVVAIGGTVWVSLYGTQPFVNAYFRRRLDDALLKVYSEYEAARRDG